MLKLLLAAVILIGSAMVSGFVGMLVLGTSFPTLGYGAYVGIAMFGMSVTRAAIVTGRVLDRMTNH